MAGGAVLAGGETACKLLSLVRNIILARLLSPEDLGVAATWAITMSLLDSVVNISADKLLVQSKEGGSPRFLATAHLFQAARGAVVALAFFALAGPISELFNAPETKASFQAFALIPLLKGFGHLDMRREQREYRYAQYAMVETSSTLVSTLAAAPLAIWLGDYRGALGALLVYALCWTAASHIVARRPYRIGYERRHARAMLTFGWPLMLSGIVIFLAMSGDRLVIGKAYTLEDLGVYSVTLILVAAPFSMAARVNNTLLLPVLSRAQDDRELFRQRYRACAEFLSLSGTGFAVLFIVGGPLLIELFYGEQYRAAGSFVGWVAAMQAIAIMRIAPALGSMALADSKSLLIANIVRAAAIVLMIVAAVVQAPLMWIAVAGAGGELLSHLISVWLLRQLHGVPARLTLSPSALGGACMAAAAIYPILGAPSLQILPVAAAVVGLGALVVALQVLASTGMRTALVNAFRDLRMRRVREASRLGEATDGQSHA